MVNGQCTTVSRQDEQQEPTEVFITFVFVFVTGAKSADKNYVAFVEFGSEVTVEEAATDDFSVKVHFVAAFQLHVHRKSLTRTKSSRHCNHVFRDSCGETKTTGLFSALEISTTICALQSVLRAIADLRQNHPGAKLGEQLTDNSSNGAHFLYFFACDFDTVFPFFQLDESLCASHSSYKFTREKGHLGPVKVVEVRLKNN